jgi:hypothetical protein
MDENFVYSCVEYFCLSFSYHLDTHIAILYIYYDHACSHYAHYEADAPSFVYSHVTQLE